MSEEMQAVAGALRAFGRHTGTSADGDQALPARWLAVHYADPQVLVRVAREDHALMARRAENPPLSEYASVGRSIDIDTFVHLMQHGYAGGYEAHPIGAGFCNFLRHEAPVPAGEEHQLYGETPEFWRLRALYLALPLRERPNYGSLVRAILRTDTPSPVALQDVYDRTVKLNRYADQNPSDPAELAAMVSAIRCDVCDRHNHDRSDDDDDEESDGPSSINEPIRSEKPHNVALTGGPMREIDWSAVRRDPNVQDYRVAAGIPTNFPVQRVVKQMLLVAMRAPVPPELLAPGQQRQPTVSPGALERSLLPLVRSVDNTLVADDRRSAVCAYLGALAQGNRMEAPRPDCLANLIEAYALPDGEAAPPGFLKKHPQPDAGIIQAVTGLF